MRASRSSSRGSRAASGGALDQARALRQARTGARVRISSLPPEAFQGGLRRRRRPGHGGRDGRCAAASTLPPRSPARRRARWRGRRCRAGICSARRTRRSRLRSSGSWPSARTRRSVQCQPTHVSFVSEPDAATQLILQAVEATRTCPRRVAPRSPTPTLMTRLPFGTKSERCPSDRFSARLVSPLGYSAGGGEALQR